MIQTELNSMHMIVENQSVNTQNLSNINVPGYRRDLGVQFETTYLETLEGLDGEFGYREYLWSEDNLAFTGSEDGYKPPTCSQEASFNFSGGTSPMVCEGERIFLDEKKRYVGGLHGRMGRKTIPHGYGTMYNQHGVKNLIIFFLNL